MVRGERKPFTNSSTVCEQKIQLDNRTRSARPHVIYRVNWNPRKRKWQGAVHACTDPIE